MAPDDSDAGGPAVPKLSWIERERMQALQRLASARVRLAELEQDAGPASRVAALDPDDLAEVDEIEAEIARLRPKASGRFGGAAAREQIEKLEYRSRLALERLGYGSYDALQRDREQALQPAAEVDPVVLEFARREFADAQQAFLEIASLELPAPDTDDDDGADADVVEFRPPRNAAS